MNDWLYFGCHRVPGHYLHHQGMRTTYARELDKLTRFDGMLPPQESATGYIATVSRLGGWGITALAFWDYSVDKRGGCNSIVFAPSLTIEPAALLAEAQVRFPEVFTRLPQPVTLQSADGVQPARAWNPEPPCWLVEKRKDGATVGYLGYELGTFEWFPTPDKATRFVRRQDANGVAECFEFEDVIVAEHIWG